MFVPIDELLKSAVTEKSSFNALFDIVDSLKALFRSTSPCTYMSRWYVSTENIKGKSVVWRVFPFSFT